MQADPNLDVRGRMINAGITIIDKHGRDNVALLFPIFENYLNKQVSIILRDKLSAQIKFSVYFVFLFTVGVESYLWVLILAEEGFSILIWLVFFCQASDEERYDLMREGVVIFTGALAKHLEKVELMIPNFF